MTRSNLSRLALAAIAAWAASPAWAQGFGGNIWSGTSGDLKSGFSGAVASGFKSGLGAIDAGPRDREREQDITLGSTGILRRSMLLGQPSNFESSVKSTGPIRDSTLTFEDGPATELRFDAGPAGPLD